MKKSFLGVALIFSLLLSACGAKDNTPVVSEEPVSVSETQVSVEAGNDVEPEDVSEPIIDTESVIYYAADCPKVYKVGGDGIVESDISAFSGTVVAGYDDNLIFHETMFKAQEDDTDVISVFNIVTETYTELCNVNNLRLVDVYKGAIYVVSFNSYKNGYVVQAFDANTFEPVEARQDLYDEIDDYVLVTYSYDTMGTSACMERLMDECGYVLVKKDGKVYLYDMNTMVELFDADYETTICFYDKDNVIFVNGPYWEINQKFLNIYDVHGDAINSMSEPMDDFIAYEDGIIYFTARYELEYNKAITYVDSYNIKTNEIKILTSFKKVPGSDINKPGTVGFMIDGDYLRCVADCEGDTVWYTFPKNTDEMVEASPSSLVAKENPFKGIGKIDALTFTVQCDRCGEDIYKVYDEYMIFDDGVLPNTEEMNHTLLQYTLDSIDEGEIENIKSFSCEDHGDAWGCFTYENRITSVDLLADKYIQINTDAYLYSGGAHGMPFEGHRLIDRKTGEFVTIEDLFTGSEEDFKKIVAEKTKEDYRSSMDSDGYSYYYAEDEDAAYRDAYGFISFRSVEGFFTTAGYTVVYPPYIMGPFASGFIYVYISYDDLGITF